MEETKSIFLSWVYYSRCIAVHCYLLQSGKGERDFNPWTNIIINYLIFAYHVSLIDIGILS